MQYWLLSSAQTIPLLVFVEETDGEVRYDVDDEDRASIERVITFPAELAAAQRDRLGDIAERTPVTRAVRAGTPIVTTLRVSGTAPPKA